MQTKTKLTLLILVLLLGVWISKKFSTESNPPKPVEEKAETASLSIVAADQTASPQSTTTTPTPINTPPLAASSASPSLTNTIIPVSDKMKIEGHTPSAQQIESFFSTERTEDEILKFLEKQRISAFGAILENSAPIAIPDPKWNGCFKGEARLENGNQWQVSVRHFLSEPGKSNSGTYTITMQGPGKGSTSRGDGTTKALRNNPNLPGQIILEPSPTEAIQIFYIQPSDALVGNLYQKLSTPEYKFIGNVWLSRSKGCQ